MTKPVDRSELFAEILAFIKDQYKQGKAITSVELGEYLKMAGYVSSNHLRTMEKRGMLFRWKPVVLSDKATRIAYSPNPDDYNPELRQTYITVKGEQTEVKQRNNFARKESIPPIPPIVKMMINDKVDLSKLQGKINKFKLMDKKAFASNGQRSVKTNGKSSLNYV